MNQTTPTSTPSSKERTLAGEPLDALNARLEKLTPQQIVAWAATVFRDDLAMTRSLGAGSMCATPLGPPALPNIRIIFVHTGFLFAVTPAFMEQIRRQHQLNIQE